MWFSVYEVATFYKKTIITYTSQRPNLFRRAYVVGTGNLMRKADTQGLKMY